jgi:hypothetical protein
MKHTDNSSRNLDSVPLIVAKDDTKPTSDTCHFVRSGHHIQMEEDGVYCIRCHEFEDIPEIVKLSSPSNQVLFKLLALLSMTSGRCVPNDTHQDSITTTRTSNNTDNIPSPHNDWVTTMLPGDSDSKK